VRTALCPQVIHFFFVPTILLTVLVWTVYAAAPFALVEADSLPRWMPAELRMWVPHESADCGLHSGFHSVPMLGYPVSHSSTVGSIYATDP
jgi:hypothetical protein